MLFQAVKSVVKFLKSPTLSADAIKAGKNQLKVQVLSEAEDGFNLAESIAAQGLYTGSAKSPSDIAAAIDQIQANDVNQVNTLRLYKRCDVTNDLSLRKVERLSQ